MNLKFSLKSFLIIVIGLIISLIPMVIFILIGNTLGVMFINNPLKILLILLIFLLCNFIDIILLFTYLPFILDLYYEKKYKNKRLRMRNKILLNRY